MTQVNSQQVQIARLTEAETVLQQMPLPAPDWMRTRESAVVRGNGGTDAAAPQLVLVRPVNVATEAGQPILECRPVSGTKSYQVSLEREGSNEEIPAPKALSATRWQVTAPLLPGQVYKWAVTAQRGSEALRSPLAKFYVLSEAEQRHLKAARQKYAHNPLTLGAVYARLGMTAEAQQQFRTVLQENPSEVDNTVNKAIAQRWLKETRGGAALRALPVDHCIGVREDAWRVGALLAAPSKTDTFPVPGLYLEFVNQFRWQRGNCALL